MRNDSNRGSKDQQGNGGLQDMMNKVVSTLLVAIIIGFVEMRITVGQLNTKVDDIVEKVKVIDLVKDEQIDRKDVIDWVREFRQNNGWSTKPYPHTQGVK